MTAAIGAITVITGALLLADSSGWWRRRPHIRTAWWEVAQTVCGAAVIASGALNIWRAIR